MRNIKSAAGLVVAGALAFGAVPSAAAVSATPSHQQHAVSSASAQPQTPLTSTVSSNTIELLSPYVSATRSGYVMDAPTRVLRQVDPGQLAAIRQYHASISRYVKSGDLVYQGNGSYIPAHDGMATHATWRTKHTKVVTHWYGLEVGLDGWLTGKIVGGSITAGGIAALFGGPYAKGIGAALAVASGVLTTCQKDSGWVYIYWVGTIPPAGAPVCNPF